jgi:hypothetical protein
MEKKSFNLIMIAFIVILLVACLTLILSYERLAPQTPVPSSGEQVSGGVEAEPNEMEKATVETPELQAPNEPEEPTTIEEPTTAEEAAAVEETPTAEKATEVEETGAKEEEAPSAKKDTSGLAPINIELPKPMFVGTPQPTDVPNLEKPLGKPRPPFYAPERTKNVAFGKPVTASDEEPIIGELEMVTDGDKEAADGSYVELGPFKQYVTIDLGDKYEIYAIVLWHYHKQACVYFDVVVQVSNDPDFITDVTPLFNNDIDNSSGLGIGSNMHYVETNEGKLIDAKGVQARYVRLYSNGNNANDLNHYIEVEVYGRPVK